ncbi:restriction endonuclease subunit S [Polaromonas sp. SM01]|uniref:restriction endonuclease subunit S n=1 Tax=Polaromonas sp. SM01 TaxID=3085630 RepID=UPI0029826D9A|nr:restriction endonuclease subunit S [Polaromonas sp. SM01]MDW5441324.1 restriction endonuclease subunit S [Polaromonas sp. SM01]
MGLDMTLRPLGSVARITSGGTPSRARPEFWGGEIPWVKTTQVQNGEVNAADIDEFITPEGLRQLGSKLIPKDAILLAMVGQGKTRGQVALLNFDAAINQNCAALIPTAAMDARFLFQQLLYRYKQLRLLSNSSGQNNLNATLLRSFKVYAPPISFQILVSQVLSDWDAAIETTSSVVAMLERRKQGLMQQLLTGRRRLKGFKGKWKPIRLGSVLQRITRKNTTACLVPLTVSAQRGLVEQSSYFAKQIAATDNEHYLLLQRGEFAYNRSAAIGYPFGAIKRLDAFDEGIVSTLCLCFGIADEEKTDSDFLVGLLDAGLLNRELRAIAHEGARSHGLLNVTATDFFNTRVSLPGIDEQRAMAEVLRDMNTELTLRRRQLDELKAQKRALMQKLLSGEWCLPEPSAQRKSSSKKGLQSANTLRKQLSKK